MIMPWSHGGGLHEPATYGYEPPSYNADPDLAQEGSGSDKESSKAKSRKRGIMYDDDDGFAPMDKPTESPATTAGEKTREEKDRENADMFRRVAEQEGQLTSQCSLRTSRIALHAVRAARSSY